MVSNIFNQQNYEQWTDTKINENGRILIVVFLFDTESVLNIITWIKKACLFELETYFFLFY